MRVATKSKLARNGKTKEVMPEWAENPRNATETPMDPEEQRAIEERISRLKSSGKNSEAG